MKNIFKNHWSTIALLVGFVVFEGLIWVALIAEQTNRATQETDLGSAMMEVLAFLLCVLLLYLFALICAALALHLSVKKLSTDKTKSSAIFAVLGGLAVGSAVVQAVVTVWNNASLFAHLPEFLA